MRKWFIPVAVLAAHLATAQSQNTSSEPVKTKAPTNWFNLDYSADNVRGVSTEKAYELLKGRKSHPVIVGVIDSGIDINHEDLKSVIWKNPKEIAGNGKDDDGNGYIDDVNGWSFLGNKDGRNIDKESLELTREYARYKKLFDGKSEADIPADQKDAFTYYQELKIAYNEKAQESKMMLPLIENLLKTYQESTATIKEYLKKDSFTAEDVSKIDKTTADAKVKKAISVLERGYQMGYNEKELQEGLDHYKTEAEIQLNTDFNARKEIIGDDPDNTADHNYGNNDVIGPDARHGTHVAGIIGADRTNSLGVKGVADNVRIMVVRAVPDGDERDKDVANAIRYAVDNGAQILNMSFGKAYSPQKEAVDEAVKYAEKKGVLLVHAAGNESKNTDEEPNFPNRKFKKGGEPNNWIEVGAISWEPNKVASFSNYGKKGVDLFSPGVALYSTVPGSKYEELDGTSMASPVVAGVAALVKSYFPKITAAQLKDLLIQSTVKFPEQQVNLPGGDGQVAFGELSNTGGEVNAYQAVKLALEWEKAGKIK
ncbi:S8 family peptidase [Siphonobacter aquaeclarae]|uniref:Subtilase family protein n=1 Tax=Siphonobacter aquaeclarae TaxID=563176 RepID=A0A1G9RZD4_9BACT|nr:S8 family peptidase [Siphonobacter aquaeclarae]SDM28370.1 Subtilase family protein [Siphonobacter aquaeclarae]